MSTSATMEQQKPATTSTVAPSMPGAAHWKDASRLQRPNPTPIATRTNAQIENARQLHCTGGGVAGAASSGETGVYTTLRPSLGGFVISPLPGMRGFTHHR